MRRDLVIIDIRSGDRWAFELDLAGSVVLEHEVGEVDGGDEGGDEQYDVDEQVSEGRSAERGASDVGDLAVGEDRMRCHAEHDSHL